ncbi:MAG: Tn3 family transposase [Desulfamplus sp.]|nr:Tn3 family transposase [Desulfamplus sp.]
MEKEKKFISIDRKRGFELTTPLEQNRIQEFIRLFPPRKSIPLTQIFNEINQTTGFLDRFEPFYSRRRSRKPDPLYFYAALLSRTQRKRLKQLGKPFAKLEQRQLKETLQIYFTLESLKEANRAVKSFVEDLEIASLPETGFSQYSFTDKENLFSRPTVLCCSATDFPYALDLLLGNPAAPLEEGNLLIKKPMECVELLFGIAKLLGFAYAMRIKDFGKYTLYGFENTDSQLKNFTPDGQIDAGVIEANWDEMLRFAVTIHTGHTPASILIPKFMNRFDDPLYLGIRELGRVQQTIFMLKYIDNLKLRQTIETHWTKSKYHQKLSSLLQTPPKPSEFTSYQDRELNAACKTLIQNCILAWNYLYLSKRMEEKSGGMKDFKKAIQSGFIPLGKHIDFSQ